VNTTAVLHSAALFNYLPFESAFMHLVQALTRFPDANFTHCKLGYCLLFIVGLNFSALSLTLRQTTFGFLAQIAHSRDIYCDISKDLYFYQGYDKIFHFYQGCDTI
jgi:hypothetical protein